ncbi:hypothetical protein [Corynebacterium belfantii]
MALLALAGAALFTRRKRN